MKDDPSRKRQRKTKASKEVNKYDPKNIKDIRNLTQKALTAKLREQLNTKDGNTRNVEILSSIIEEFLSSYIIMGYALDGTPINIISAHNQQEADSLTTLINKFINHGPFNDSE